MQRLIARLRRVRERPPSGSAAAPGAAGASQLRGKGRGGLHSAAASGDLAQLQRHWWWKRLRINGRDAKQQTPLHLACANGHADVVRFLAGKGCQLNPRDNFEKSPLMMAVEHQHKDCAAILLEHGANPDLRGADGNTALHLAAIIPSKSLVDLLLKHNAHIDAQNELGYTPLTAAITKHHEEMVEFLLQKGATMHAEDKRGSTALMTAAFAGDVNTVRLLLQHGVDISHEEVLSQPAMSYIVARAYADVHNHPENNAGCERTGECNAGGKEGTAVLDISSSGNTANFPFHESALPGAGVLPVAGAEQEEDDDSLFHSEMDSEGPRKASAGVLPPAAAKHGACAHPLAEERDHGVLPAAGAEQEEDDDSLFHSEMDSEGPRKASAGVLPPAAAKHGACAHPLAEERDHGVLPAAGAEQEEDDDISCLSTALSLLELMQKSSFCSPSDELQCDAATFLGFFSPLSASVFSCAQVSLMETEDLQLKKDASTQADYPGNSQRWVRQLQQKLADALKKNSLAEASLEAKKRYSRDLQEQKLRLQKELDRSKAKLQELKERHIRTECYAKSLKNAIKNKEKELAASRDLQGLLATSSGIAAIPELEERLQRLHVGKARLEATAQQQAKTIKALQKDLQASASALNGLEDSITGFRATQTAEEHQHRQCGSQNKEVKELAKLKCRSEVLLDEMRGRNIALEEERTRLKMLLEGSWTKLMAYVGRESQLSFRGEMKSNSSKVDNQVGKLRRKLQLNFQHG